MKREDAIEKYRTMFVSVVFDFFRKSDFTGRNLCMPGDGRYQPDELKTLLGYDQWAAWLIIVEWFWMAALHVIGEMPEEDACLLTEDKLHRLLISTTTEMQDKVEKKTSHDILALLELMRIILPTKLHKWLHFGATSYDVISTAYALQAEFVFNNVFMPAIYEVDELWRGKIEENKNILQAGRTHLQTALPITVGYWLACLHNRFANSSRNAHRLSREIVGKFSGAVGTYASQKALMRSLHGEKVLMEILFLPEPSVSTQITPPETMSRFYFELVLISGVLANLGEDTRILQSSQFGEIISVSSSSSAMAHKTANPIAAENVAGMHESVKAEFQKVMATLVSDLQRDLRGSSIMRSQSAVMVYVFQQIKTTKRLLNSLKVNEVRCLENYEREANLLSAEILHLFLQRAGFPESHKLVNKELVPALRASGGNLFDKLINHGAPEKLIESMSPELIQIIKGEKPSLGLAVEIAEAETKNNV